MIWTDTHGGWEHILDKEPDVPVFAWCEFRSCSAFAAMSRRSWLLEDDIVAVLM